VKTNTTMSMKFESVQPTLTKPLATKVISPNNNTSNLISASLKQSLNNVNSGKIIKTMMRKPYEK
jgi:hypothetical protein